MNRNSLPRRPDHPIIVPVDEIIHTDERPFCSDPSCPCHDVVGKNSNEEAYLQHIAYPLQRGLLTAEEANRIYFGEQLS